MLLTLRILEFILGVVVVVMIIDSAVRTFVLPRPAGVTVTRIVARAVRFVFDLVARSAKSYEGRDRVMALYGPVTLLTLPVVWLVGVGLGYALMFHSVTHLGWRLAIRMSGSSVLTLGFALPQNGVSVALVFSEAAIGLVLVALLIAYLPTMYSAFSRREVMVSQLTVRAGSPPRAATLLTRAHAARFFDQLDDLWRQWEVWFVETEETHTSLAMLNFFRSTNPNRSWLTSAGVVLDAAAIRMSCLDMPFSANAGVCIRAGFIALRSIADFFQVPYDPDPAPGDPIAVSKDEFLAVYDELAAAGLPMLADRDQCWVAFSGWRVNYDSVLITMAGLIMAPYAEWVSDRSLLRRRHRPPVVRTKR